MNKTQLQKVRDALVAADNAILSVHGYNEALDILDRELAAPEQEPFCYVNVNAQGDVTRTIKREDKWCKTPLYRHPAHQEAQPVAWQPIETAPHDNKRSLYLARIDEDGELVELDFGGAWEYWQESWEMAHINGWDWVSARGIEDPTHWAYQDEPLPVTAPPSREWVGLTEKETDSLRYKFATNISTPYFRKIARAIEAALRTKNTGER